MVRALARLVFVTLALIGLAAAIAVGWLAAGGTSAKTAPGEIETAIARRLRAIAIPRAVHDLKNPTRQSPETLRSGLEHFADHCAVCHANDGSGDTEIGRGLYPRPPDMRRGATQSLSDGELFYIIENGIRFTGMPAWSAGTAEGEAASWHLVQFIRHLPKITAAELEEMKAFNPKTADEWRAEEGDAPARSPRHAHGVRER